MTNQAETPPRTLEKKQVIRTVVLFTVIMAVSVPCFYFAARAYVISLAEKDIKNLLLAHKGIHHYVQQVMHPALYDYQEKGEIPRTFYAPELFSSSFIVRNQHSLYNKERELSGMPQLYYKMAAINPRNPLNKADEMESKLIRLFNSDKNITSYREIVKTRKGSFLYVALPFLPNTKACLKCHGNRTDAPVQLQERYPGEGGFNEMVGDIRAIISIRAPLAKEYSTILVIVASLIMGLMVFSGLFFFNARLRNMVSMKTRSLETEITEREQTQKALAEEKELLSITLSSIGDGVITTDIHGRIAMMNKVASELTGWDLDDAEGKSIEDIYHAFDNITREQKINQVREILSGENVAVNRSKALLISKNGIERTISSMGAPIRDKDSRIIGSVLILRDITEQLRTEEELTKVKKLESIGILAGGIAHDFNNILSVIIGNIDLSIQNTDIDSESRLLLSEAHKASMRAQTLTRQLLTFAKGGEPVKETASLKDVIMESANFILRGSHVACTYSLPDDLYLVYIDKGQFSQVIQNMILNASQAMSDSGNVEVACKNIPEHLSGSYGLPDSSAYVQIDIKDTGVGIPTQMIDRIFDPYFTTKQNGNGLGLAICHSIVTKHNGHIRVNSLPGEGTIFSIFLPAAQQKTIPAEIEGESHKTEQKKAKIMIMDDEDQILIMTRRMLEKMGHDVLTAKHGDEAIRLYEEELSKGVPVDLVIMDLTIPGGMGGKDTVNRILDLNPHAKVIVSSGYSTDPIMSSYRDYGFCKALVKPFKLGDFKKAVNAVLSGYE